MPAHQRRYSNEEIVRRGAELFENQIRQHLQGVRKRDFLAIDIETGAYEIDTDELAAGNRLRARIPGAQIFMRRVGSPYLRHYGGRRNEEAS